MKPAQLIEFAAALPVPAAIAEKRKRFTTSASHLGTGAKIGGVTGAVIGAGIGAGSAKIVNKAIGEKGGVVSSSLRTGRTGLLVGLGLGAVIGGAIKKSNERIEKEKAEKRSKLFRQLHDVNQYEQRFGVILLGIPEADFQIAEETLTNKLDRALAKNLPSPTNQVRAPLPGPLPKYPTSPNPNPNASEPVRLQDILDHLKKKYSPTFPGSDSLS